MAGETPLTVVGNLTADPELRYTQSGVPVVNFTIASTPRTLDRQSGQWKDGEALFLRCSMWREFAENVAGSLSKGMRVIAQGNLRQRNYETREGERRSSVELDVQEIGPSLRYATAQVTRAARGGGATNPSNPNPIGAAPAHAPAAAPQQQSPDSWAVPPEPATMFGDDTPF